MHAMRKLLRTLSRSVKENLALLRSAIINQKIRLLYPTVQMGRNVRFYGPIHLRIAKTATVRIGDNVTFRSSTAYNFVGINRPVSIYVAEHATLEIGDDCGFSGTAIYAATHISIGNCCNLGGNSSLWDTDFHPLDYQLRRGGVVGTKTAPIRIGSDVFVGANALILKGVTVGERSVIGAGSVVARPVPADQIWAGNPARFVRHLSTGVSDLPVSHSYEVHSPV